MGPRAASGVLMVALAACGPALAPATGVPSGPSAAAPIVDLGAAAPPCSALPAIGAPLVKAPVLATAPIAAPTVPFRIACKLPEPRKSDDPCATDADCGVSEPCHARACVAKARSNPAGPGTTCTRNLVCDSADANRCGCFEGRCALIPH